MNAYEQELLGRLKVCIKQIEGDYDEAIRLDTEAVRCNWTALAGMAVDVFILTVGTESTVEWALFVTVGMICCYINGLTFAQVHQKMRKPDFDALKPQDDESEADFTLRAIAAYEEVNAKNAVSVKNKVRYLTRVVDMLQILPIAVLSLVFAMVWHVV